MNTSVNKLIIILTLSSILTVSDSGRNLIKKYEGLELMKIALLH